MPGLLLENVVKSFALGRGRRAFALRDVSIEFSAGQLCVLLGQNGAGKSTLFDLIGGQAEPDSGQISLGGHSLLGLPAHRRANAVTRIYQSRDSAVPRSLLVEDVVGLALRSRGLVRSRGKVGALLSKTRPGLDQLMGKQVWHLSGGEHQLLSLTLSRVAVESARGRPHVLLLDEHVSQLDPLAKERVLDATIRLVEEAGAYTVVATHDIHLAAEVGERQVLLHKGRVVADLKDGDLLRVPDAIEDLLRSFVERGSSLRLGGASPEAKPIA